MEFSQGWDSVVALIDGRWVERRPRRAQVAGQLRRETTLMPWLAPQLPLPVPDPRVVNHTPLVVRHALVPGNPIDPTDSEHGRALGRFLRALHASPATEALRHGLPPAAHTDTTRAATINRFRTEVLPLIPTKWRGSASAVLEAVREFPADTVVHGDLGPEHLLVHEGRLSGVIDFGDTHLGDPAIDLAWSLYGTPTDFAAAVADTYNLTPDLRQRALTWHLLGPWYEVTHGIDTSDNAIVHSGVTGLLDRLQRVAG